MDHLNPQETNRTVSLALRKYSSTVPQKKGSLFINPGGPGGSGTEEIARNGKHLSIIVQGMYDVISWDPRGVNLSSPAINCFPTDSAALQFQHDVEQLGLLYEHSPLNRTRNDQISPQELAWAARLDAMNQALARTCVERGDLEMLSHQSTASTARDLKLLMQAVGDEKLNYWGFSYVNFHFQQRCIALSRREGTLILAHAIAFILNTCRYGTALGSTFAAMFPELVGRMVLDGVMDVIEYTQNMWKSGLSSMKHTHKTFDAFLSSCIEAGERCALYQTNSTLASLHERIDKLRLSLHSSPLPVVLPKSAPHSGGGISGILTTSAIQHSIFRGLYHPKGWPELARGLAQAEKGNGTLLWLNLNKDWNFNERDPKENLFNRTMIGSGLVSSAISCLDTDPAPLANSSLEDLILYHREMNEKSISGEAWSYWIAACRRWSIRAKDVYRGPWSRAQGLKKTANRILFVGNSADPVTPLSAARRMAEAFGEDSASLLIHEGFGHCSYAHPSTTTNMKIQAYFNEGILPEFGEKCPVDPGYLFPEEADNSVTNKRINPQEDVELQQAMAHLADRSGFI